MPCSFQPEKQKHGPQAIQCERDMSCPATPKAEPRQSSNEKEYESNATHDEPPWRRWNTRPLCQRHEGNENAPKWSDDTAQNYRANACEENDRDNLNQAELN